MKQVIHQRGDILILYYLYLFINFKVKLSKFLNHNGVTIFMAIITIYSLFADDIRQLAFTRAADPVFWSLTCLCFFFFTLEIILSSIALDDYFLSFYFFLDIIATASLIFDIGWLWNLIT